MIACVMDKHYTYIPYASSVLSLPILVVLMKSSLLSGSVVTEEIVGSSMINIEVICNIIIPYKIFTLILYSRKIWFGGLTSQPPD